MDGEKIKNLALSELPNLLEENRLRCFFLNIFHQSKAVCIHCGKPLSDRAAKTFLEYRITSCINCHQKVQFFQRTALQNAKISPEKFFLLAVFLSLEVPVRKISDVLGLSPATIRLWKMKLGGKNEIIDQ